MKNRKAQQRNTDIKKNQMENFKTEKYNNYN